MTTARYIHVRTKQVFGSGEFIVLTRRDIEILTKMQRGLLDGQLQRDIARELGYSWASSLRHELEKLMRRFGVVTKYQLINKAVKLGILRGAFVAAPIQQKTITKSVVPRTGRSGPTHSWRHDSFRNRARPRSSNRER